MTQHASSTQDIPSARINSLLTMANRLRRHSLTSTSTAGSGHPSSCFSCAEIMATIFFHFLRFDVSQPRSPYNDRFVLSKGHAAPILWGAWAEAGAFPVDKLATLRQIDSDLEGHPTPRNPLVDVATGSLGQGLSVGVGMALGSRMENTGNQIFVLMGDGETAEGAVWEAFALASHLGLGNLTAILDVNRLGQSQSTMYEHHVESYQKRLESFDWHTQTIDGHNVEEIVAATQRALSTTGRPSAIIARTLKGKGVSFMEDKDGWHGKPVPPGEELDRALKEIGNDLELASPLALATPDHRKPGAKPSSPALAAPVYAEGDQVATRQAYGNGLARLGAINPKVVALDADTKNSTYSQDFLEKFPDRFVECFIAEQNMVGAAVGLSAVGRIPFASTFACFLSRAYDQIRMAAVSQANIKLCGSHAGISIGQDGPSQMGLEDLAMMRAVSGSTVLYPSDGVSAERLVALAAETPGVVYIRTSRPKTPILYSDTETFRTGGSQTLRSSDSDRATLVAAGVTLHEALKAYEELIDGGIPVRIIDLYSIKPVDRDTLQRAARETGLLITVEDHYPEGGLGDAVLSALADAPCRLHKLAVTGLPRSGAPVELMDAFSISATAISRTVHELLG